MPMHLKVCGTLDVELSSLFHRNDTLFLFHLYLMLVMLRKLCFLELMFEFQAMHHFTNLTNIQILGIKLTVMLHTLSLPLSLITEA